MQQRHLGKGSRVEGRVNCHQVCRLLGHADVVHRFPRHLTQPPDVPSGSISGLAGSRPTVGGVVGGGALVQWPGPAVQSSERTTDGAPRRSTTRRRRSSTNRRSASSPANDTRPVSYAGWGCRGWSGREVAAVALTVQRRQLDRTIQPRRSTRTSTRRPSSPRSRNCTSL